LRNSGKPVGDKKCPADFGLQIFAVPWTTREVVCADMFNFFTPSLFKGGNPTFFYGINLKGSPPLEKGRTGGISGKAFSVG
jgi:hypothetical protein